MILLFELLKLKLKKTAKWESGQTCFLLNVVKKSQWFTIFTYTDLQPNMNKTVSCAHTHVCIDL